jgi:hypothetical protein
MMDTPPKIMLIGFLIVLWLGHGLLFSASRPPEGGAGSHGFELNISLGRDGSAPSDWSIHVLAGSLLINAIWKS